MAPARPLPRQQRLNLSRVVRLLIRDVSHRLPDFAHVRAENVLVVAGEARRRSRATVRPLRFQENGKLRNRTGTRRKPKVVFRGKPILYVITLRPLFFRASSAEKRVETVLHELFHMARAFDGTLDQARRHDALAAPAFEKSFRPLVKRYLAECPQELIDKLSTNGEVLVRHWLEKPANSYKPGSKSRKIYTADQTFLGPVRMITRATKH